MCCCLFQAPNLESRELWKGFLYSVIDVNTHVLHLLPSTTLSLSCAIQWGVLSSVPSQLNVPSCLTLLPGQLQMLKEVVDKERSRRRTRTPTRAPPSPLSVPLVGEIPPWVLLCVERTRKYSCFTVCVFVPNICVWRAGVFDRSPEQRLKSF